MSGGDEMKENFKPFLEILVGEIKAGHCAICKVPVITESFVDELSRREYAISQMCQKCQNSVFGESEEA
jgi:hypothetical protein